MITPAYTEALKALEKAADAIENAEYNLKGEFILATANRTYYACYYCMTALLYTKHIYSKTHKGTHVKFSEEFIKTKVFPVETSDSIKMLFDYRQEADYDLEADFPAEVARVLIKKATEFYNLSKDYLEKLMSK